MPALEFAVRQSHAFQARQGCRRCPPDAPRVDQAAVRVVPITTARGRDAGTAISSKGFPKQRFRGFGWLFFSFCLFSLRKYYLFLFFFLPFPFIYLFVCLMVILLHTVGERPLHRGNPSQAVDIVVNQCLTQGGGGVTTPGGVP